MDLTDLRHQAASARSASLGPAACRARQSPNAWRLTPATPQELDCVIDYADHGAWLRVPLSKLNDERTVPLDQPTIDAFDEWVSRRGRCRPQIRPRNQRPVEFLFVVNGRRMGAGRIRRALDLAAAAAGLGHVDPHQLRHTYADFLATHIRHIDRTRAPDSSA